MADIKGGGKEFIDINRIQKILRGVAGIKSILLILAILRREYGVMGPRIAWIIGFTCVNGAAGKAVPRMLPTPFTAL